MPKKVDKEMLGRRIKQARIKADYTQGSLAEELGISPNYLGDIERGIKLPSVDKAVKIANTLGISLDYMFADSLDPIVVAESESVYLTDKQLKLLKNLVKTITDNFVD